MGEPGAYAQKERSPILNAMTVDVEDYFQVAAFKDQIALGSWDSYPLRVGDNTRRVMDLFAKYDTKATFFVLGWVAERLPGLVREISERGHDVASHGYAHQLIYSNSPEHFRQDIRKAKDILEQIIGKAVIGYRAPTYSITKKTLWALDILVEEGFKYDSSIFPIVHDLYGIPGSQRFPYTVQTGAGELSEFPITTTRLNLGWRHVTAPVAGGGYLRLFPIRFIVRSLKRINTLEHQPAVVYFHPWEIDPGQPRISNAPLRSRFRHYVNLHRTSEKITRLLATFQFAPIPEVLGIS
jgi:polysaccharide deacetylase family protein (PEP-CTERM system associated)